MFNFLLISLNQSPYKFQKPKKSTKKIQKTSENTKRTKKYVFSTNTDSQ